MRTIKFRAWDVNNKEMLDVQELDYQDSYNGQPMVRTTMYNDYFDVEDMILMQYTGLKDITGREIYEGDIVKSFFVDTDEAGNEIYKYYIIEVKYDEVLCSYKIDKFMNLEVIGNIYENKELLNETNR